MPTRDRAGRGLTAVRVVGALLPPAFLETIASLAAKQQSGADYGLSRSLVLKDEIARYWRIANDLYAGYKERCFRKDLDPVDVGIHEWLVPLLKEVLGYADLKATPPIAIGERRFPNTHRALDGTVPLVLTLRGFDLDRANPTFGDEARRRAAHGLMQELLNADDRSLWGLVSNGTVLRLLRDNPSLTRPAYIDVDLEQIFEEQLYADFAALWLTLHATRLQPLEGKPSASILETWRLQANETGQRALEHLREGVTAALRALGNGFLQHPQNDSLRASLAGGSFSTDSYFQQLLRLVYRFLFVFAAEERHLLFKPDASEQQRDIYREGYAIARLRDRALRRRHYDKHPDLWQGLRILFRALADGASPLGLPSLGGLFAADQCPNLDAAVIANEPLLEAVRALAFFRSGSTLLRVNYRDMGTEELGSVYESLLELHPYLDVNVFPWSFRFVAEEGGETSKGSTRRLSGSYYTPATLVNELIKSTLEPAIARAATARPEDPRSALLELRIVDPACGSGHFLLAAARRIAAEIARIEAGTDTPDESARQHALREVVQHCIYGVDRNRLAVELCKTALWIETVEPGKPLTFLDPHIRWGDSLVGVLDPAVMADGIPDSAYKALTGDDGRVCRYLKRRNRQSEGAVQGYLFTRDSLEAAADATANLDAMPEETLDEIAAKREAWERTLIVPSRRRDQLRANLFVGAFFAPKTNETADCVPLGEDLNRVDRGMVMRPGVSALVNDLLERHGFFHWYIEFAEIMARGGFDAILGNPPWERVKLQEQEFFANRSPAVANAPNKAARDRLIQALRRADAGSAEATLLEAFETAKRQTNASSLFARGSGRFPLTGVGDVNTYGLFAELFKDVMSSRGHAGIIVPTEILSGEPLSAYFRYIVANGILKSSTGFENEEFIFPGIANVNRFALMTLGPGNPQQNQFTIAFYLRRPEHLAERERFVILSTSDFQLLNPNSQTSPVFRSTKDAELTKSIYRRVPVLIDEADGRTGDPWGIGGRFMSMFHMSSDSHLFRTAKELGDADLLRDGEDWIDEAAHERYVRLYEGKFIWHYDQRFSSYHNVGKVKGRGGRGLPPTSLAEYSDPGFAVEPRYWVNKKDFTERISTVSWTYAWVLGARDVTSAKLERTFVLAALPRVAAGHTLPLFFPVASPVQIAGLVANLSSIVFDYVVRQKMAGTHLTQHYFKQFPVLPPSAYDQAALDFVAPRVLELSYTSEEMRPFARDLGFDGAPFAWDPIRRAWLRAELDAYYARLYGVSRDELRYILDPHDVCGTDYPSETFRVLKEREMKEVGEYLTARLVLAAWDQTAPQQTSEPGVTVTSRAWRGSR